MWCSRRRYIVQVTLFVVLLLLANFPYASGACDDPDAGAPDEYYRKTNCKNEETGSSHSDFCDCCLRDKLYEAYCPTLDADDCLFKEHICEGGVCVLGECRSGDTTPPTVWIGNYQVVRGTCEPVNFDMEAADDSGISSVKIEVDGEEVYSRSFRDKPNAVQESRYVYLDGGSHHYQGFATDVAGLVGSTPLYPLQCGGSVYGCERADPSISVTLENVGPPGSERAFNVSMGNRDAGNCGSSRFRLSVILPEEGWSLVEGPEPPEFTISPGEYARTKVVVKCPEGATPGGDYMIRFKAADVSDSSRQHVVSGVYHVELDYEEGAEDESRPECLWLMNEGYATPFMQEGKPGEELTYEIRVTNRHYGEGCGESRFKIYVSPGSLIYRFDGPSEFLIGPQESATTRIRVKSPEDSTARTYPLMFEVREEDISFSYNFQGNLLYKVKGGFPWVSEYCWDYDESYTQYHSIGSYCQPAGGGAPVLDRCLDDGITLKECYCKDYWMPGFFDVNCNEVCWNAWFASSYCDDFTGAGACYCEGVRGEGVGRGECDGTRASCGPNIDGECVNCPEKHGSECGFGVCEETQKPRWIGCLDLHGAGVCEYRCMDDPSCGSSVEEDECNEGQVSCGILDNNQRDICGQDVEGRLTWAGSGTGDCDTSSDCVPAFDSKGNCVYMRVCRSDFCACGGGVKERCPKPGTVTEDICYYGERRCTESGCEGLLQAELDGGQICDPVGGPVACVKGNPEIRVTPDELSGISGSTGKFRVEVANRDSAACPPTEFSLAYSVPDGWIGSLSKSSLTLAPGETGGADFGVNSPQDADASSYDISLIAESGPYTSTKHARFIVDDVCIPVAPTVEFITQEYAGVRGQPASFAVKLMSNNGENCKPGAFKVSIGNLPTGWTSSLDRDSPISLNAGESATLTLTIAPSSNAQPGSYYIIISASYMDDENLKDSDDFAFYVPLNEESNTVHEEREHLLNLGGLWNAVFTPRSNSMINDRKPVLGVEFPSARAKVVVEDATLNGERLDLGRDGDTAFSGQSPRDLEDGGHIIDLEAYYADAPSERVTLKSRFTVDTSGAVWSDDVGQVPIPKRISVSGGVILLEFEKKLDRLTARIDNEPVKFSSEDDVVWFHNSEYVEPGEHTLSFIATDERKSQFKTTMKFEIEEREVAGWASLSSFPWELLLFVLIAVAAGFYYYKKREGEKKAPRPPSRPISPAVEDDDYSLEQLRAEMDDVFEDHRKLKGQDAR
jgi:hypothetical protein